MGRIDLTHGERRGFMTTQKKQKLLKLVRDQNYKCFYCGEKGKGSIFSDFLIEHIIPRSKGGTSDDTNLVASCWLCNSLKTDLLPHEFVEKLNKKIKKLSRLRNIRKNFKKLVNERCLYEN